MKDDKQFNIDSLVGEYNNFQQYWQENTEEDMHRVESIVDHKHIHLTCQAQGDNLFSLKLYKGRDKSQLIAEHPILVKESNVTVNGIALAQDEGGLTGSEGFIKCQDGTIVISGLGILDQCDHEPYVLLPCRYFSGWLQYPPDETKPDELYSLRDLELHDQGGYVELDVEGVDYTAELTQLVYAKTLKIMKLAIYDVPLKDVGINSKAISYTWVNPDATRIGINLRKIISGWTMIEPDFVNSNNLNT